MGAVVKKRTGCTVRLPPTARLSPTFCCYYFSVCFSAFPPRRHTLMLVTLLLLLFACQRLSQIRKQTHKHSHTHTHAAIVVVAKLITEVVHFINKNEIHTEPDSQSQSESEKIKPEHETRCEKERTKQKTKTTKIASAARRLLRLLLILVAFFFYFVSFVFRFSENPGKCSLICQRFSFILFLLWLQLCSVEKSN